MLKLCDDIDTLSMMLCDGELADQELRDVELHLIDCPTCRAHVDRDRGFLGDLRGKLAAPPAPDLLRQRLGRALDDVDRQARRPVWKGLGLPAAAVVAAAAALAVFAIGSRSPAPAPAHASRRAVAPALPFERVEAPAGVPRGASIGELISALNVELVGSELLGADVAHLTYWLVAPGVRVPLYATVQDAARLGVDERARVMVGGYDTWTLRDPDELVVRDGARAIRLSSPLGTDLLRQVIGGTSLVARIGADDPRR